MDKGWLSISEVSAELGCSAEFLLQVILENQGLDLYWLAAGERGVLYVLASWMAVYKAQAVSAVNGDIGSDVLDGFYRLSMEEGGSNYQQIERLSYGVSPTAYWVQKSDKPTKLIKDEGDPSEWAVVCVPENESQVGVDALGQAMLTIDRLFIKVGQLDRYREKIAPTENGKISLKTS
ncbi:MAG: hypothetical protein OIF38_06095, partial [Cellvibrionaceae bacterium]|nr:hypothetical protein [Cellvibrionaceae bacterium]